jgi:plastocyanin
MRIRGPATFMIALVAAVVCGANGGDGASGGFKHVPSPSPLATGTIRGHVELRQPLADSPPRPSVTDLGMAGMHAPVDRRSVVYLDPAPRAAFDTREEPRPRMDQRNETFFPHVLAIVAGTTVDFPNSDQTYHNVFSLSKTKSFDLGRYAVGRSKAVRFDRPGIVRVFCDIHSHMSAYILVFNHPFFALTAPDSRYVIANVPAGIYTLRVWSELGQVEPRKIAVAERETVEANFQVGRDRP